MRGAPLSALTLALALACGMAHTTAVGDDGTPNPPALPPAAPPAALEVPDPAPWLDVLGASLLDVSADGHTVLFRMNRDGVTQLFRTGREGGWPFRLTYRSEGVDFAVPSPDGAQVVLGYDHDGDENHALFLRSTAVGKADERLLAGGAGVQHGSVFWAREGDRIFYRSNADGAADFHLFERRLSDGRTTRILDQPGMWSIEDVAPGGVRLLVAWERNVRERSLYVLDVATGVRTEIDPRPAGEAASPEDAQFLGAGDEVLFSSDRGGEWSLPWIARLSDGSVRPLLAPATGSLSAPAADVDAMVATKDGKTIYLVQNEGGRGHLRAIDAGTGANLPTPDVGDAIVASPRVDDEGTLFFTLVRSDSPGSIVRWDRASDTLVPLTHPDMAGLPEAAYRFVPRLVEYATFDGRKIPAWLYLPSGKPARNLPFLLQLHGGPTGQERPSFSPERAYLLSQGFGILAPNVRGSTGYGRTWRDLDDYRKRLDSVKDAKAGADWLVAEGLADPKRLAAIGGSYGGYMVLALLTEYPSTFAAGAESVGIANFETFLERTAPYRRANRESEYGPLTDREFLRSISPIHKVGLITARLLIAHGENDPRVPVGEARQMEKALRDLKRPVEAIYFKDEGHGFSKRGNRRTYFRRLAEFLGKALGPP